MSETREGAQVAVVDCGPDDRERLRRLIERLPTRLSDGPADAEALVERAAGASVLATLYTYTRVTESVLEDLPELRMITTRTAGAAHIDVDAAARRQITVTCVPDAPVIAVAEYTLGAMIAAARHLPEAIASTREGDWRFTEFRGGDLNGRVLGIIGLGAIGTRIAELGRAVGMRVIGWSRSPKRIDGVEQLELEEVLASSDFLSLNIALNADTVGFLDAGRLAAMKPGAYLINTARGELVDFEALRELLSVGRLGGACLDVLVDEPAGRDRLAPLAEVPNLTVTPHISWHTEETLERQFEGMTDNILAFCAGRPVDGMAPGGA